MTAHGAPEVLRYASGSDLPNDAYSASISLAFGCRGDLVYGRVVASDGGASAGKVWRRLVMCCDGTWNNPDQLGSTGVPAPTNVAKLALGVAEDDKGTPQLLYYQSGVGTRRFQRVRGGVFGYGLSRNVRACYRFVVETYEPGDELYFVGFSRGAYTARSTVGLINNCGILRPEHRDRLDEAYALYKSRRPETGALRGIEAKLFRKSYSYDVVKIHFVGVWDTVGAIGIPIDGLPIPDFIKRHWGFHSTELNDRVSNAYQALAIDERRRPFKPALWQREQRWDGQALEQVWFAGAHRDVGGGTRDPSLSEIPLMWMVNRARRCGLAFKPLHFVEKPSMAESTGGEELARAEGEWLSRDPLGPIHESFKGPYMVLGPKARTLGAPAGHDQTLDSQFVASTALARRDKDPGYAPDNLKDWTHDHDDRIDVMDDLEQPG